MKIEKLKQFNSFNNEYRRKIFDICKDPKSFTELKKKLNISTGALVHHLKVLEDEGLIKKETIKENNRFKVGRELKITSVLERLEEVLKYQNDMAEKQFNNAFPEERKKELLSLLKQSQPISRNDFKKILMQKGFSIMEESILLTTLAYSGLINEKYELSEEGEKFLKENEKK